MDSIFVIVASNTVALGVLGYLLKQWIEKRLSHSLGIELEKFKHDMAKELTRYSTQQKWVNDKRMELFVQLSELLVAMSVELKLLFIDIRVKGKNFTDARAEKFCERYFEFNAALHKNELFLSPEFLEKVGSAYKPYFDIALECMDGTNDMTDFLRQTLPSTIEEIAKVADAPRMEVVRAFREAAGIDS